MSGEHNQNLENLKNVRLEVIGYVTSCFPEKFGIPRQAGIAPSALATIELLSPFNRKEMVRGLETFSHIWIHFLFHESLLEGWKATVRPPRMGGAERLGVFATRSPHRPNHIGLSAVRLLGVRITGDGVCLDISGVDLLDGTPVLDIKPYIPYSDCLSEATRGWLPPPQQGKEVEYSEQAESFCRSYEMNNGRPLAALIQEVLLSDPRPSSQKDRRFEFGFLLWDVNVRWKVSGDTFVVIRCDLIGDSNRM